MRCPVAVSLAASLGAFAFIAFPGTPNAAKWGQSSTAPDPTPVFKAKCVSCHSGGFPAGGLDLSADLTVIAGTKSVVRGRPHDSGLFKAVDSGDMPKGGSKLSPTEIASIRDWVMSLRPDPRPLFTAKCVKCHQGDNAAAGLKLTGSLDDLAKLSETDTGGGPATDATLYKRVADGTMPRGGTKLSDAEMTVIKDWIAGLHPNPKPLFQEKCARCHGGATPARGLDLSGDLDTIAGLGAVVKGQPSASSLYKRIADGTMPRGGKPLSDSEAGLVWDWIVSLQPPKN